MVSDSRNVWLALIVSAGLHLIVLLTLAPVPGGWQHGFTPALRATLRPLPSEPSASETALAVQAPSPPAAAAKRAAAQADAPVPGLNATRSAAGASVPLAPLYYRNSEVDVPAVPLSQAPLVFPELAFVSRLAGTVRARVFISEEGVVESVQVEAVSPRPGIFEEAALQALRQVRYRPAELAGQRVKTQKVVEVTFNPYERQAP